jgi:hypothetical protein
MALPNYFYRSKTTFLRQLFDHDPTERSAILPFISWKSGRILGATDKKTSRKIELQLAARGDMVIGSAALEFRGIDYLPAKSRCFTAARERAPVEIALFTRLSA